MANEVKQLVRKGAQTSEYENIYPKTYTESVRDKSTGESIDQILNSYNQYFVPYTGNDSNTRRQVPISIRRKGLWITYVRYSGSIVTEWYGSDDISDSSFGLSSNWRVGSNSLIGDISISSEGNWVINGKDSGISAKGDTGETPLLRIFGNRFEVSYDGGISYKIVNDTPVYTKYRIQNNKLQQSQDLGSTWTDVSDYIAAWFQFTGTAGDSQTDNIGKIQISRDGNVWSDLSGVFTNSLYIKGYKPDEASLPSDQPQGSIYAVGPTYDSSDTSHTNPIYRLYVRDSSGWVDNGRFTSISAGVLQSLGSSEVEVLSQKAITKELNRVIDLSVSKGSVTNVANNAILGLYIEVDSEFWNSTVEIDGVMYPIFFSPSNISKENKEINFYWSDNKGNYISATKQAFALSYMSNKYEITKDIILYGGHFVLNNFPVNVYALIDWSQIDKDYSSIHDILIDNSCIHWKNYNLGLNGDNKISIDNLYNLSNNITGNIIDLKNSTNAIKTSLNQALQLMYIDIDPKFWSSQVTINDIQYPLHLGPSIFRKSDRTLSIYYTDDKGNYIDATKAAFVINNYSSPIELGPYTYYKLDYIINGYKAIIYSIIDWNIDGLEYTDVKGLLLLQDSIRYRGILIKLYDSIISGQHAGLLDIVSPDAIYCTCNDLQESLNKSSRIYIDHFLNTSKFQQGKEIDAGFKYPSVKHFDIHPVIDQGILNNNANVDIQDIKIPVVTSNFSQNIEFTVKRVSTLASYTQNQYPKVLVIGDSVTAGYLSNQNKSIESDPNTYWSWTKYYFTKDQKNSKDQNKHRCLMIGMNIPGTWGVKDQFQLEGSYYPSFAIALGGISVDTLYQSSFNNSINPMFDPITSTFNLKYFIDNYRTMDDNGNRLYFNSNNKTTGVAGEGNIGYYQDGSKSSYYLGKKVYDVTLGDVCTPTTVVINLNHNSSLQQYQNRIQSIIDSIKQNFYNINIVLMGIDEVGTVYPQLYPEYSSAILLGALHNKNIDIWKHIVDKCKDEKNGIYALGANFVQHPVYSLSSKSFDTMDGNYTYSSYGSGVNYHPNNIAHKQWGYLLYSMIKYLESKKVS